MPLVFCTSFLQIPVTISLIERYQSKIIISTSDIKIYNFLNEHYKTIQLILIPDVSFSLKKIKSCFTALIQTLKYKKILAKVKDQGNISKVYFFYLGTNPLESWFIKKYHKQIKLVYAPIVKTPYVLSSQEPLKVKLQNIIYRSFFNVPFKVYVYNSVYQNKVETSFWVSLGAETLTVNSLIDSKRLKQFTQRKLQLNPNLKVLILTGTHYKIANSTLRSCIKQIVSAIATNFGENSIAIKQHPNYQLPLNEITPTIQRLPKEYPANLLIYHFDVIISLSSAVLFEVQDCQKTCISILNLIPLEQQDYFEIKSYIESNSSGNILYPKNLKSLLAVMQGGLS